MEGNRRINFNPATEFFDGIPFLYAPFKEYVLKIVPLMLEHIWQQKHAKKSTIDEELLHSGWICRLITLDKRVLIADKQLEIQGWPEIKGFLQNSLESCTSEESLVKTVDDCIQYLLPTLESRFQDNYRFPLRDFHCWWYTIHDDDTHLAIHLINAYQPDSPFDHLEHFRATMLHAIDHGLASHPDIKIVSCGSWLNQVPKFQYLWPESFIKNQKVVNITGGFGPGVWGQYMTVDGGFNEEKALILRKTGKHPFPLTESFCFVEEIISHLRK